jgi:glycosyltransferase involved in cell wall biosynthesis
VRALHLVAADRWTGAAATALQAIEALRAGGHDIRFAYRPGRGLSDRLVGQPWAFPALPKERSLGDLRAAVERIRRLAEGCDVVHVHLPHDHTLAALAFGQDRPIFRSVRHPRHLRADPYHRWLFRRCSGVGLANRAMEERVARLAALRRKPAVVLPIALEPRFIPGGDRSGVRARYGIPGGAVVAGTIGKLSRDRGQDLFVRALATAPAVWGVIVGKGPFEQDLRRLAAELGVAKRLVFAGYVEQGLEDQYAAMDLFVFPAAGSDWAHRAVAEAAGCGLPTLAASLPGIGDLVVEGETGDVFPPGDAEALGALVTRWAAEPARRKAAGSAAAAYAAQRWTQAHLAAACHELYAAGLGA